MKETGGVPGGGVRSKSGKKKKEVPPRWIKCPNTSELIADRFFVFKTPLGPQFDKLVPPEKKLYPETVLEEAKNKQHRIGLWVDVTNVKKYYSPASIEKEGVQYVKLKCRGHGETPTAEETTQFIEACRKFVEEHPQDAIGVHCIHGFNRSGFLVCAFLTSVAYFKLDRAITHFGECRPPGIFKQRFITELYQMFGSSGGVAFLTASEIPDWCYEYAVNKNEANRSRRSSRDTHVLEDKIKTPDAFAAPNALIGRSVKFQPANISNVGVGAGRSTVASSQHKGAAIKSDKQKQEDDDNDWEWAPIPVASQTSDSITTQPANMEVDTHESSKASQEMVNPAEATVSCEKNPEPDTVTMMEPDIVTKVEPDSVTMMESADTGTAAEPELDIVTKVSPPSQPDSITVESPTPSQQQSILAHQSTSQNNIVGGWIPNKRVQEPLVANPRFMSGAPGVIPLTDLELVKKIQWKVQDMCYWPGTGFPGSQPVLLNETNMDLLGKIPYLLSWKTDGVRYLMLIDGLSNIFLIDQEMSVFHAPHARFLHRKGEDLRETLVDGYMVLDVQRSYDPRPRPVPVTVPRFIIHDIIKYNGKDVQKLDFPTRLKCIQDEIILNRHRGISSGAIDRTREPFSVRNKPFWFLQDAGKVLCGKLPDLTEEPCEAIFVPCADHYVAGFSQRFLKWRSYDYQELANFRLKINVESCEGKIPTTVGELFVLGMDKPVGKIKVTRPTAHLDNKIIECLYECGRWLFNRERTDKVLPNSLETAKGATRPVTTTTPLTKEFLLDFIEKNRWQEKPKVPHPESASELA